MTCFAHFLVELCVSSNFFFLIGCFFTSYDEHENVFDMTKYKIKIRYFEMNFALNINRYLQVMPIKLFNKINKLILQNFNPNDESLMS